MHKELLEDIGEKELIERLSRFMPRGQTSDDCAFINLKNSNLLINTDSLVENIHFDNNTISPRDVGWKAVASNISDLISSGCERIIGVNISLVMPAKTDWLWIEDLYTGINEALLNYGGLILGGDCSVGSEKVITITCLGTQGKLKLRRYACKPGEVILTTGIHGLSKLGFMLKSIKNFEDNTSLTQNLIKQSLEQFCRPQLRPKFLKKLLKTRSNKNITYVGCTDSSDGLFQALLDLSKESNCKGIIDYQKIPKHKNWPNGENWDEYCLFGGEDYELVFSLPKKWAKSLQKKDKNIKEIGYFVEGNPSVEIKNFENKILSKEKTFSHF